MPFGFLSEKHWIRPPPPTATETIFNDPPPPPPPQTPPLPDLGETLESTEEVNASPHTNVSDANQRHEPATHTSEEMSTLTDHADEYFTYLRTNVHKLHNIVCRAEAASPPDHYHALLERSQAMISTSDQIATSRFDESMSEALPALCDMYCSLQDSVQEACSNLPAVPASSPTTETPASSSRLPRDIVLTNRLSSPRKKKAKKR